MNREFQFRTSQMSRLQRGLMFFAAAAMGMLFSAAIGCHESNNSQAPPDSLPPAIATVDSSVSDPAALKKSPHSDTGRATNGSADATEPDADWSQRTNQRLMMDPEPEEGENSGQPEDRQLPSLDDVQSAISDRDADEKSQLEEEAEPEIQTIEIPDSWKRLSEPQEIWIDMQAKQVIAAGNICLNAGVLEVFICPRNTKEHESVISLNALASQVHAALLAIGAEPGSPVSWQEEYQPATGPVIQINVLWKDPESDEQIERRGQELVRNIDTGKEMELDWVFGGSGTYTDPDTGKTWYYADSGELVCVSNFSTATMDVPVESSEGNESLLFEANTSKIPDVGTKVYVTFGLEQ